MVRVRDARSGTIGTLPGLAPVAMQEGRYAARLIRQSPGGALDATVSLSRQGSAGDDQPARAVAEVRGARASGLLAWVIW